MWINYSQLFFQAFLGDFEQDFFSDSWNSPQDFLSKSCNSFKIFPRELLQELLKESLQESFLEFLQEYVQKFSWNSSRNSKIMVLTNYSLIFFSNACEIFFKTRNFSQRSSWIFLGIPQNFLLRNSSNFFNEFFQGFLKKYYQDFSEITAVFFLLNSFQICFRNSFLIYITMTLHSSLEIFFFMNSERIFLPGISS